MTTIAATQADDGRHARTPTDIPAPGWKQILLRVFRECGRDRILLVAAGVTFYLLLAMVPAMTALVSTYGLFNDPASVQQHLAFLQDLLPEGGREVVGEQLARLSSQRDTRLGFALAASLGIALWSANAGVKALFEAMNVAYDEEEKRGFVRLTLVSLAFTAGAIVLLLVLVGVTVVMPIVLERVGLGGQAQVLLKVGSGLLVLLAAVLALSALYRWGPSREQAKWRWVTPGAIVAIVIAGIASAAFSWYVGNFGSYNETYGSLGALIGFMTWLWIMVTFVIAGGELNAEMEHQTAQDSTTGPDRALGARGAEMADTVARGGDAGGGADEATRAHRPGGRTEHRPAGRAAPRPDDVGTLILLGAAAVAVTALSRQGRRPPPAAGT